MHISTQGVFSGNNSPYTPYSDPDPITCYGQQKAESEYLVLQNQNSQVIRLTFVIGVRPYQDIGRKNPLESILEQEKQCQVMDRFFSPVFAFDAASIIWDRVLQDSNDGDRIIHVGNPISCSRYSLAKDLLLASNETLKIQIEPVSYTYFSSDTTRPRDTTWKKNTCLYKTEYFDGLKQCLLQWRKIKNDYRTKS